MDIEPIIQRHGRELFELLHGEKPGVFSPRRLSGKLMQWSMADETLKTELFRLVDVLPALESSREVSAHLSEYLDSGSHDLPLLLRLAVRAGRMMPWLARIT